jgi:hypothetical protein
MAKTVNSCEPEDKPSQSGYVAVPMEATSRSGNPVIVAPSVPESQVDSKGQVKK